MSKRERQNTHSFSETTGASPFSNAASASTSAYNGAGSEGLGPFADNAVSIKRRKLQFGKSTSILSPPNSHSNSNTNTNTNAGANNPKPMEEFRSLDANDPKESQRMKTRYKMIQKGKNTVGYDEYLQRVPKKIRRKISDHPMTPDHTLDIPNRRWLGQVKAWRRTLHQYDPKDLKVDMHMASAPTEANNDTKSNKKTGVLGVNNNSKDNDSKTQEPKTVQDEQIAQASSEGLQVDFTTNPSNGASVVDHGNANGGDDGNGNNNFEDDANEEPDVLDQWYEQRGNSTFEDDDDSDDDLL